MKIRATGPLEWDPANLYPRGGKPRPRRSFPRCDTCGGQQYRLGGKHYCPECEDVPDAPVDACSAKRTVRRARKRNAPRECNRCGRVLSHYGRGLCKDCYQWAYYRGRIDEYPRNN